MFIIVSGKEGDKFLVQERTMTKDYCPGCYDLSTGGVFSPGETKLDNGVRELEEETGLKVVDPYDYNELMDYGWLKYVDLFSKVWGSLFLFRTT